MDAMSSRLIIVNFHLFVFERHNRYFELESQCWCSVVRGDRGSITIHRYSGDI